MACTMNGGNPCVASWSSSTIVLLSPVGLATTRRLNTRNNVLGWSHAAASDGEYGMPATANGDGGRAAEASAAESAAMALLLGAEGC